MAKFIKSIFTPEKKKTDEEEVEGEADPPPLDSRRKLSMSRSGRLKQAYKRRQQLSVEVYGGEDLNLQPIEKPKSLEYHVNTPSTPTALNIDSRNTSIKSKSEHSKPITKTLTEHEQNGCKSPEEEIDKAFDIIDKS